MDVPVEEYTYQCSVTLRKKIIRECLYILNEISCVCLLSIITNATDWQKTNSLRVLNVYIIPFS